MKNGDSDPKPPDPERSGGSLPLQSWSDWSATYKIPVPEEWSARPWNPTQIDRAAAWELYTEISTRITTQPLHARSGDESAALKSVFDLFERCRELIKKHGPASSHFADVSRLMLNREVRPFTARWHQRDKRGELAAEDTRQEFRAQLSDVRTRLVLYERAFRDLSANDGCYAEPRREPVRPLGPGTIEAPLGVPSSSSVDAGKILEAEKAHIEKRRGSAPRRDVDIGTIGMSLSGGGIRSATFCLGVLQAIARRGVVGEVDYLSTVSGGGYIGSYLVSILAGTKPATTEAAGHGAGANATTSAPTDATTDGTPAWAEFQAIQGLRRRSIRHLLGAWARSRVFAAVLMIVFGLVVNVAIILLVAALVAGGVFVLCDTGAWDWLREWFWPIIGIAGVTIAVGMLIPRSADRAYRFVRWIGVAWIVIAVAGALLTLLVRLHSIGPSPQSVATFVGQGSGVGALLGVALRSAGFRKWANRLFVLVVAVAAPLVLLVACWLAIDAYVVDGSRYVGLLELLAIAISAMIALFVNVNETSPYGLYRLGLTETYLRSDGTSGRAIPKLSALNGDPAVPYLLINTTVNLPRSTNPALRGRASDVFVMSPAYSGSAATNYHATTALEAADRNLDLGAAMALSAAAASPQSGTQTNRRLVSLMTLFNVRLGYWVPNLNVGDRPSSPGIGFLVREATGSIDEKSAFVNLSDGGHIENLGLYELLRRRCRFLIVIDAEADEGISCAALLKCQRLVRSDFGIDIRIDLRDLEKGPDGRTRSHFVLGVVEYPAMEGREKLRGYLLYVKSSLTGDEDAEIGDYRRRNPTFPHQSTADQFFDEEQFEAYRALGEHVGERLFRREILPERATVRAAEWLTRLRETLLPDDHDDRSP